MFFLTSFIFRVWEGNAVYPGWRQAVEGLAPALTRARTLGPWKTACGSWANAHEGASDLTRRLVRETTEVAPRSLDLWRTVSEYLPEPAKREDHLLAPIPHALALLFFKARHEATVGGPVHLGSTGWSEADELRGRLADAPALTDLLRDAVGWDWAGLARLLREELGGFDRLAWKAEISWESEQVLGATPQAPDTASKAPARADHQQEEPGEGAGPATRLSGKAEPGQPSPNRQNDIIAAILAAATPLTRPELVTAMRLKVEGKLGHHLAWMVRKGRLKNIPQRGYWPAHHPIPE
jgi:hypothetical protein